METFRKNSIVNEHGPKSHRFTVDKETMKLRIFSQIKFLCNSALDNMLVIFSKRFRGGRC